MSFCQATVRPDFIDTRSSPGAFCIARPAVAAPIVVAEADFPGVVRAANDLAHDVGKVSGTTPRVLTTVPAAEPGDVATMPILVGTLGKSPLVDALVKTGRLDVAAIGGRWESYVIRVVADPMPGVPQALVIAGSDKRGTIFGLYDVSENIGVSPWYWWADVPVKRRDALWVRAGGIVQGPPAVKYRGIFLNDEAPAMSGWTKEKFGGFNSKMYTRVFELLLRLRANYLWPAMWGNAFNEDDPANARLADEYGIVMGTSHQEAMLRAQAEFDRRFKPKEWNYATHPDLMENFWREGIRRNRAYESLITIGMRGRDDTAMIENASTQQSMTLLERIVARQRQIIAEEVNPDVTRVAQVWCLYKEVQGYYEHGLRVPDDVTLLWADDNWGNLRRLPTAEERRRAGGAGIYYHFDYVGDPRNYKWLNTNPLPKIQEQLNLAYTYGADRVWIVNVGDLKPVELPIDFFMTMAWDPKAMTKDRVADYTRRWAEREFGPERAAEIADVVEKYAKYNAWRKPELLSPTTFSVIDHGEAERVEALWDDVVSKAEAISKKLPADTRDAFYELVLYPTKASATVTHLYIASARNALYANQGRASAVDQAARVRELFQQDQQLSDAYNRQLAGGKWNHMMDQTRIGYTNWQQPAKNVMPAVVDVAVADKTAMGVAVEGSAAAWPGNATELAVPSFDSLGRQTRWIDVFRRGTRSFAFTASADRPWIKISSTAGATQQDQRLTVTIDWAAVPDGANEGGVTIASEGSETARVRVRAVQSKDAMRSAAGAFGSLTEAISIPAAAATRNVAAGGVRWERLPDYGRGEAAMTLFPVDAASASPPTGAACLEYDLYLPNADDISVKAVIAPTLSFVPGRGLRLAVSIDDGLPQTLDAAMTVMGGDQIWRRAVSDGVRVLPFTPHVDRPGRHTLKVWRVDAGVVLQSLVVGTGPERPSYFGPPLAVAQPTAPDQPAGR